MLMVQGFVRFPCMRRVKELADIAADFPRVLTAGNAAVIVLSARFRLQSLLFLLAGFACDVNLHGGQVCSLERDGITAAGRAHVRTVRLADTD